MVLRGLSNSERGLYAEYLVYQYFLKDGYKFYGHRMKTPMAEIDLLFGERAVDRVIAIEVKTSSNEAFLAARVTARQKMKLRAAQSFLQRSYFEVQMLLAVVSHDASIDLFESFLS